MIGKGTGWGDGGGGGEVWHNDDHKSSSSLWYDLISLYIACKIIDGCVRAYGNTFVLRGKVTFARKMQRRNFNFIKDVKDA